MKQQQKQKHMHLRKLLFVLILILSNLMLHLRLQTSWTRTIQLTKFIQILKLILLLKMFSTVFRHSRIQRLITLLQLVVVLQWIQLRLQELLLQTLNSKTFVVLKVSHLLRSLAFLLLQYQQQPELLQRLQLTMLLQTLKESVNSFVLIHTICQLQQLQTLI